MGDGDFDKGRARFIEHCISVARVLNLRVWKGGNRQTRSACGNSLKTLLGGNADSWEGATKSNVNWILDIWEAACGAWEGEPIPVQATLPVPDQGVALLALHPIPIPNGQVEPRLSARILEAYADRDADKMITALAELEKAGL
jgi:hypothetical protein